MLLVALDAGASKAGMVVIRATTSPAGTSFVCLRHGHLDLELDGGAREEAAVSALLALADFALQERQGDERLVFAVEGVEGFVYAGRSATHLFDTADQAGGIRMCIRTWARMRGVKFVDVRDVRKTTAKACRRFVFGKQGDSFGDNEVVLAVQACGGGMPPMPVPVPSPSAKAYSAMHAYDAALVALAVGADVLGWVVMHLPDTALTAIATYRIKAESEKATKKLLAAAGVTPPRAPRVQSRGTKRRRREAAIAAARRTA
jgi:hypothetical protein